MGKVSGGRNEGWGRRLRAARAEYEKAHDVRLKWSDLARMVSEAAGHKVTYQAIQQYFKGREPDFRVARALAVALQQPTTWLVFAEGEMHTRSADALLPYTGTTKDDAEPIDPGTAVKRRRRES